MARADIEVAGHLFIEPDKSKGEAAVKSEESDIVAHFLRVRNLRSHKLLSQIGFIVGSYQEHTWFYEMWELARKAVLVGVIAVVNPGTIFQILIGLFVCMMSTFVSLILNPYKHPSDGWLNNICLVHLTLTLFLGLLLKMNVDIFGSEGSGDRAAMPFSGNSSDCVMESADEASIAYIIIASHGSPRGSRPFCCYVQEIRDAPTYQRALRESEQRKREAVRKHIENWARGMRQQIQRDMERQRLATERRSREEEDEKREAEAKKHADELAKKEREAARLKLEAEIKQMKDSAKHQGLSKAEIDAKMRSINASAAEDMKTINAHADERRKRQQATLAARRNKKKADKKKRSNAAHMREVETAQLARQAELKDEYDQLQAELSNLANVSKDTTPRGVSKEAQEFLLEEKERLARRKQNLEIQLKSIMENHNAQKNHFNKMIQEKKDKVHAKLMARRAKANSRRKGTMVGHDGRVKLRTKSIAISSFTSMSSHEALSQVAQMHKLVDLHSSEIDTTAQVLFQLVAYFGKGEEALDAKIVKYVKEHHDDHGLDTLRDEDGNTMLIAAVRYSNLGAVKLILDVGEADVTLSNSKGATALHYAAAAGNKNVVETILAKCNGRQAFISKQDNVGNNAAMYAMVTGNKSIVELLGGTMEVQQRVALPPLPPGMGGGESKTSGGLPRTTAPLPNSQPVKTNALSKWRAAAWVAGVRRYNAKRGADAMMKNAVMLLLAKHRLEQRIKEVGAGSDSRLHELEDRINQMQDQMTSEHEHAEELQKAFEEAKVEVQAVQEHEKHLAEDLDKEAKQRKKLHNQIEDMKGAIRVFCRIRPLSGSELARGNIDITEYMTDRCSIEMFPPVEDPNNPGQKMKGSHDKAKKYTFDAVFSPVDGQETVFEDVSHVVQSAVDGYNVCVFAYGQTGSGKTWTMSGNGANPGVQPRSVGEIFSIVDRDSDKIDFKVRAIDFTGGKENWSRHTHKNIMDGFPPNVDAFDESDQGERERERKRGRGKASKRTVLLQPPLTHHLFTHSSSPPFTLLHTYCTGTVIFPSVHATLSFHLFCTLAPRNSHRTD